MIKKAVTLLLCLLICLSTVINIDALPSDTSLSVSAKAAVLIDGDSCDILYRKNETERLPMASTTKIMTAIIASEFGHGDELYEVPKEAIGIEGSSMYLVAGEHLTMNELITGLMLESANDASVAIAMIVAGSVKAFADMMNAKAEELGLKNTHFTNPHGLDDPDHYTTAYDLACLASYALSIESLKEIVSTKKTRINFNDGEGVRLLVNHNKMLRYYKGAVGVKTGFTKRSGRCLVSAAERDGLLLISVTINAPDDWHDHTLMLDYGFNNYCKVLLADVGVYKLLLPVVGGVSDFTEIYNNSQISVTLPKNHGEITCTVEAPQFLMAPVALNDPCGKLIYKCDGKLISETSLVTSLEVAAYKPKFSFWNWIKSIFRS